MSSDDILDSYQLDGDSLIAKGKHCSAHGGLIIYLHNDFEYKTVSIDENLDVMLNESNRTNESLWEKLIIEIQQKTPNSKKYIICNMYRVPNELMGNLNIFTEIFSELLNILHRTSRIVYVCGDTNINLLKINDKRHYAHFFESILSAGFYPKINLPTRFDMVHGSASLIDNIFTNEMNDDISGVFTNEISDHQMIYTMSKIPMNNKKNKMFVEIETANPYTVNLFLINKYRFQK